jgi:hypothetical protein
MIVGPVYDDCRPECTATKAINAFKGEEAIVRSFARFDVELSENLVDEKITTSNMTGSAHADCDHVFSLGSERKRVVKVRGSIHLNEGHSQFSCGSFHGFLR